MKEIKLYVYSRVSDKETEQIINKIKMYYGMFFSFVTIVKKADFILCIGDDNDVLSAKNISNTFNVPIVGINSTTIGFLHDNKIDDILQSLIKETVDGVYYPLLSMEGVTTDELDSDNLISMSDITIKSANDKKINIKLTVDELDSDNNTTIIYNCDSLVFSTPIGAIFNNLKNDKCTMHPYIQTIMITSIIKNRKNKTIDKQLLLPEFFDIYCTFDDDIIATFDGNQTIMINSGSVLKIMQVDGGGVSVVNNNTFFKAFNSLTFYNDECH
jgi:NAD kinase